MISDSLLTRAVVIPPHGLPGDLTLPKNADLLVIFAHGSGSSRLSPRNKQVAQALAEAGLGTLLFDLLSENEAQDRKNVFDISLLGERLVEAIDWADRFPATTGLPVGLFGASTGAAAAVLAAAQRPGRVAAIVSRGGRPDLAGRVLPKVKAPTLMIVGGADEPVLSWTRNSIGMMTCRRQLQVIPNAGHLFEEPGAMEQVVTHATDWFDGAAIDLASQTDG